MRRTNTTYCTFEVPDDWQPAPPFDFTGPGKGGALAVRATERHLEKAVSAELYAKRQKELLPAIYDDVELLQEGSHKPNGPGDGYSLMFRFRDDTDEIRQAKAIYLTWGPIVGELLLLSPVVANRDRDRWFGPIEKSFALRPMDFLAKEARSPLIGELSATDAVSTSSPVKYPLACVAIPTPSGWSVAYTESGEVAFAKSGAEIRLQRSLRHGSRSDAWFQDRLQQLRTSESLILGFEQGQLSRGRYAALLFEERALARTWKTSGAQKTLELFLADRQPLLWVLRAPESSLQNFRSELERLIAATIFLPPEEWETRLAEPWLEATLRGPWGSEGTGLYLRTSGTPLMLQVDRREKGPPLEKIQSTCNTAAFRKAYGVETTLSTSEARGLFKGHDAFRFSLDGLSSVYASVSLRAGWFSSDRLLYSFSVKGEESREVETLYTELLERLRLPVQ